MIRTVIPVLCEVHFLSEKIIVQKPEGLPAEKKNSQVKVDE